MAQVINQRFQFTVAGRRAAEGFMNVLEKRGYKHPKLITRIGHEYLVTAFRPERAIYIPSAILTR